MRLIILAALLAVGAGQAFAQQSDDFNGCAPDAALWTFVDPLGNSSASISGIGGLDPKLAIHVPAGINHNAWTTNTTARLLQAAPDSDFSVEAKFDSVLDAQFQMEGILIEEAIDVFLRLEFHYTNSGYRGFIAHVHNGSADVVDLVPLSEEPRYMRVTRVGHDWTVEWAGAAKSFMPLASFNRVLAVSAMGPYAGNFAPNAPEFTALVDYFEVTGSSFPVLDTAPIPQDRSLTISPPVGGNIAVSPIQSLYSCDQTVSVTATPDAGNTFAGWTGDLAGLVNPESLSTALDRTVGATFTTGSTGPVISGVDFAASSSELRVVWNTDRVATSRVEWGLTTSYELGVLDDANLVLNHDVVVQGLAAETAYHVRVRSTDSTLNETLSSDFLVTTALDPANVPSGFFSDDFNSCQLDGQRWTVYDPLADSTVMLVGGGTTDARLSISIPAGAEHEPWTTNNSTRVLQAVANTDLSVELKFDSVLSQGFQMQGLTVQSDPTHYLRLEFYSTGSQQNAFAAIFENGSFSVLANAVVPPDQYMRVSRAGDLWTFERSPDGSAWMNVTTFSHPMIVTEMGPHAGTATLAGSVPANNVLVDYVMTTLSPIVTEDVGTLPADKILGLSVVGSGVVVAAPDKPAYACGELVSLTATPSPGYSFGGWTGDLAGAANPESILMSASAQVTATFDLVLDPPGLSNIQVSTDSVQKSATVSWTTVLAADGIVDYGTTPGYELGSVATTTTSQNQAVLLANLTPGINYHYRVVATTPVGGSEVSPDATFNIPLLPGEDPSGIITDDFNTCALDTRLWRVRDPLGDGVVSVQGAGTGDASLVLSVPAGPEHDPWIGDTSLSVLQSTRDTDFALEAKFDSSVVAGLQLQGVVVKENDTRFLRFGVYSDGMQTRGLIASVNNTSGTVLVNQPISAIAPFLLEVVRVGDNWDYFVSGAAGSRVLIGSVSQVLIASDVGVYSGNAGGSPPAHTAIVDYFRNQNFSITNEDLGTPPLTVALNTSVIGSGGINVSPTGPTYSCGTVVTVTAVPLQGNEFVSWSGDVVSSNSSIDIALVEDTAIQGSFQLDSTPPVIIGSSVVAGPSGAEVRFATDEATTYRVRYGLTPQYEIGLLVGSNFSTEHTAVITGLTSGSVYHFDIEPQDLALLTTTSPDQIFTTSGAPGSGPAGLFSDDFNSCAIDSGLWTVVNPLQDATYTIAGAGAGNARLEIAVPGGFAHEPWGFNTAPRLMQPIVNADFEVEVRFDSPLSLRYQEQGVLVESSPSDYLRFDFHSDGVDNFAFAGLIGATSNTVLGSQKIAAFDSMLMRVSRVGNDWTQSYSFDGISWIIANQFSYVMTASSVGVFAGNTGGGTTPAHTAIIDYFSAFSSPAIPEDFGSVGGAKTLAITLNGPGSVAVTPDQTIFACGESATLAAIPDLGFTFDVWGGDLSGTNSPETVSMTVDRNVTAFFSLDTVPPLISGIDLARGPTTIIVSWTTNEPTTSRVSYGLTTSYELGFVDDMTFRKDHAVIVAGLDPNQTYHLEIDVTDGAGFQTVSGDLVVGPAEGPVVSIFYGSSQEFGAQGLAQPMFNLLGNAVDPDGLVSVSWSLNGGGEQFLTIGSDTRRLWNNGDFNAEILASSFQVGLNSVLITATDSLGNDTVEAVTIDYMAGTTPVLPFSIDWTMESNIQSVAQIPDGEWVLEPAGLRSIVTGYDRTVAVGDMAWSNYEVVARVTVNSIDPVFTSPSNGALLGIMTRWIGHTPDGLQPATQWFPYGAFASYIVRDGNGGPPNEFKSLHGDASVVHGSEFQLVPLETGVPYVFKVRVETVAGGSTEYFFKMWKESDGEPVPWDLSGVELAGADVASGSVLLVSHHVDATWHDVSITPIVP